MAGVNDILAKDIEKISSKDECNGPKISRLETKESNILTPGVSILHECLVEEDDLDGSSESDCVIVSSTPEVYLVLSSPSSSISSNDTNIPEHTEAEAKSDVKSDEEVENKLFFVDTDPCVDANEEIPRYRQDTMLISNIPKGTSRRGRGRRRTCFNCKDAHLLRDCPLPKNNVQKAGKRKNMAKKVRRRYFNRPITKDPVRCSSDTME